MNLFKIQLEENDVILIEIDTDKIDLETAHQQFIQIQNIFPNNKVIAYPKGTKLHFCNEKDVDYIGSWKL